MGALFESLFNFIVDVLEWFATFAINVLIQLFNITIQMLADVYSYMIGILPDACFLQLNIPPELMSLIGRINWFIPLGTISACVTTFCCGMIGYFMVRPILKFIQMT